MLTRTLSLTALLTLALNAAPALADDTLGERVQGTCTSPEGPTQWTITLAPDGSGTWISTGKREANVTLSYDLALASQGRVPIHLEDQGEVVSSMWAEPLDSGHLLMRNERLRPVLTCALDAATEAPRAQQRNTFLSALAGTWKGRRNSGTEADLSVDREGRVSGSLEGEFKVQGISTGIRDAYITFTPKDGEAIHYIASFSKGDTSLELDRIGGSDDTARSLSLFRTQASDLVDSSVLEATLAKLPESCLVYSGDGANVTASFAKDGTFQVWHEVGSFTPLAGDSDTLYAHYADESGREEDVIAISLLDIGWIHADVPSFGPQLCVVVPIEPTEAAKTKRAAFIAAAEGTWNSIRLRRPAQVNFQGDRITYTGSEGTREGTFEIFAAAPGMAYAKIKDAKTEVVYPVRITYDASTGVMEIEDFKESDDTFFEGRVRVRR